MAITITTRGILFDMDGVLISSTGADERCWLQWAKHHKMEGTFSVSPRTAAAPSTHSAPSGLISIPSLSNAASKTTTPKTTVGSSCCPALKNLLASLPADRWTIVTSATVRLLEGRLKHAGLPIPETLVPAERVANGKPHPEPYLTGAKLLKLAPADCLVIEDSPAGVASGKAAGCRVLAVLASHTQAQLPGADWYVHSLEQVTAAPQADGTLGIRFDI